ncbi:MAG: ABC transporter ATP-binding protein [Ruminococcaceae bacterium]|nr:ABC transporter ATP-binding protein [Oscillospiraceae bacterium]
MDNELAAIKHAGPVGSKKETLRRFALALKPHRLRLFVVLLCVFSHTFIQIYAPYKGAQFVDFIWAGFKKASQEGSVFRLSLENGGNYLLLIFGLYLTSSILYACYNFLMTSLSEMLSLDFRKKLADKEMRLPLRFFDGNRPGEFMSRVTSDLDSMSEIVQTSFLHIIMSSSKFCGALGVMLYFEYRITLLFLVFMLPSFFIAKAAAGKTLKYSKAMRDTSGEFNSHIEGEYSGRTIISAFCRESESIDGVSRRSASFSSATRKINFIGHSIWPLLNLANRTGIVVLAVAGGFALIKGVITPGIFGVFFHYANAVSSPLGEMLWTINGFQMAISALQRIYVILDAPEEEPDSNSESLPPDVRGEVKFCGVKFGYTPDNILMKNIDFTAKAGKKIAIVGSTGAGKTTLINLLMRFYELNGGKILLDGTDIKNVPRADLRSCFGMVLQDTWFFEGTIAENIAYGKKEASREEIIAAAKAARADYFIRTLPGGYDHMLQGDTDSISAGQKQLLTIARVVLCDPAILILDEATSSVDTHAEAAIGKAIKKLMADRTSFVIAHRLSTIVDADFILMMESGNIIETGNHKELLALGGAYAGLYNSQFE